MIYYLLQVSILLGISLLIYQFILSTKTMFKFNRWFLLSTLIGSIFVPLIPFEIFFNFFISKPIHPIVNISELNELTINIDSKENTSQLSFYNLIDFLLIIGSFLFLIRFFKELFYIVQLKRGSEKIYYQGIKIYKINIRNEIFSFGKSLFIDVEIFDKIMLHQEVWLHEKAHIQQNHTIDRLIVELCKIVFWFHPFIYKYAENIKINHEFLADDEVLKTTNDIKNYQNQLLDFIETKHNLLVSTFNFKLTKKRFIMMKNKTKFPIQVITKFSVLFVVISVFILTACTKKEEVQTKNDSYTEIIIGEAQVENANNNESALKNIEQKALPSDGMENFYFEFVKKFNTSEMENNLNDSLATIVLNFVVEIDGSISNIKATNNTDKAFADEAIRVLKSMPNWIPGKNNGEIVRSNYNLPIKIRLKS